jgi:hypothetical protein
VCARASSIVALVIQQPEGEKRPDVPVTPASTVGIAMLDVSVIVGVPTHGEVDEVGVGTVMSGLRPAPLVSVMPGGVVPSVNTDPVTVLEPGSVGSILLIEEVAAGAIVVGLQMPDMSDVPNEDVTGSGATEGVDEETNPGVIVALLEPTMVVVGVFVMMVVAVPVADLVIPVVGHIVIAPRDVPGIGPKVPRLSCTAPNRLPVAPTVGIVPGTDVGDVMGVAVDDVVGVAGARRVVVDPTWATAVPPPIKTTANIVRSKHCIKSLLDRCRATLVYF